MNPKVLKTFRKNEQSSFNYRGPKCFKCCYKQEEHNEMKTNAKKFENLDVECIKNIIKYLSWTDLMAMRQTCQTFKAEVERFIKVKNQHGTIFVRDGYEINITGGADIEEEFFPFIRNVIVQINNSSQTMDVFQAISNRCVHDIRSLSIRTLGGLLNNQTEESAVDVILAQLNCLTMLELWGNISLEILKHCINLQYLRINQHLRAIGDGNGAWTNQTYPKLKTLAIHTTDTRTDLKSFLQNNPQLEAVAIDFRNDQDAIERMSLLNFKLKLGVLVQRETENDIEEFERAMRTFSRMKSLESIELVDLSDTTWTGSGLVHSFPYFNGGIHCSLGEEFDMIDIKSNVKRCCWYINHLQYQENVTDLVNCFPNLIELRLNLVNGTLLTSKEIMLFIVSRLKHLKHVYLKFNMKIGLLETDLLNLYAVRKVLDQEINASPVTIHLNKDEVEMDDAIMPADSLVSIQHDCDVTCKLCAARGNGFSILEYMDERLNGH